MKVRNIDVKIVQRDCSGLPVLKGDANEWTVRAACKEHILQAAVDGKASVTLPAFGCDGRRFPLVGCAKITAQEILCAGRKGRGTLKEIIVCLDNDESFKVFEKQVFGYLKHVIEDMSWGPYVTTDIIIEFGNGIILIERINPPFGWALPGGFVDNHESLESAAVREAKEETNLDIKDLKQFHTYSDPSRDLRFHTVSTVFIGKGVGHPQAGDDAKGLRVIPFEDLRKLKFAFDHNQIIEDYLRLRENGSGRIFNPDIA